MVLKIMFWSNFSRYFENLKYLDVWATTAFPKNLKINSKEWNNKERAVFNP